MKRIFLGVIALVFAVSISSCRNTEEKTEETTEEVQMEDTSEVNMTEEEAMDEMATDTTAAPAN